MKAGSLPVFEKRRLLLSALLSKWLFCFCLLPGLVGSTQAGFVDESVLSQKFLDPNRPALVFITGGGSATDEQRRARASILESAIGGDVVIYKPDGFLYLFEQEMSALRGFLVDRKQRGLISRNLHFLVSSAGAGPFERWIYDPAYLPAEIGAVIIAQPFSPNVGPPAMLTAAITPLLYVVYDIRMPNEIRQALHAGPRSFSNPAFNKFYYVVLGLPENEAFTWPQVLCQHALSVGRSEDLSTNIFRNVARDNVAMAEALVQSQKNQFGLSSPPLHEDDLGRCIYCLEVIATSVPQVSGQITVTSLGTGPSINNDGLTAFIARFSDGTAAIFAKQDAEQTSVQRAPRVNDPLFGEVLQVNDRGDVVWRQQWRDGLYEEIMLGKTSPATIRTVARRWYDSVGTPDVDFPSIFGKPLFDISSPTFFQGVTLNNNGQILFTGRLRSDPQKTFYASPHDATNPNQDFVQGYHVAGQLSGLQETWPMLADDDKSVARWGDTITSPLLLFQDRTLLSAELIFDHQDFESMGRRPGTSDDGQIIAFAGRHRSFGAGIFAVDATRSVQFVAPGAPAFLSELALDERVGVNRSKPTEPHNYTLAYLATRSSGDQGLYTTLVEMPPTGTPRVGPTRLVFKHGDAIVNRAGRYTNLTGFVGDIKLYDPINNNGQLVAWVEMENGSGTPIGQAIIRATRLGAASTLFGRSQLSITLDNLGILKVLLPDNIEDFVFEHSTALDGPFYPVPVETSFGTGALSVNLRPATRTGFFRVRQLAR